jgi:hypothetical protein
MRVHGTARGACRRDVHLIREALHAVVGEGDRLRVEGVRLEDVGAGLEIQAVDLLDDRGLRQDEEVVVALDVLRMVPKTSAAVGRLVQRAGLDHGPHRAIDHGDALLQERAQANFGGHARFAHACFAFAPSASRILFTAS